MPAELFVVLAAGLVVIQIASVVLRRAVADERPYLFLLAANLAALGFVHATDRDESALAVVAEVIAGILTLTPRFLERRETVAVEDGRLKAARVWSIVKSLLVPGRASSARRRQIKDLIDVRANGSDAVAKRLRDQLARTPDLADAETLHEELVAILLIDGRYAEGTEHFVRHLGVQFLVRRSGLLPQLVHAWGELGELDTASSLIAAIEASPLVREPLAFPLVMRARIIFLAYAGWPGKFLDGQAAAMLSSHERSQLRELQKRSRPELSSMTQQIAAAIAMRVEDFQLRRRKQPTVTLILIALNVIAYAITRDETGALARAGALIKPAVMVGEWWRMVMAMFLHGGVAHIAMNMYGLYILGRFVEELCGGVRFFVIYFLGGLIGSTASTLLGRGMSVGASGAIMGLLGAVMVLVVLRRTSFSDRWRKLLLWNLVILVAVQIGIDYYAREFIDRAAHIGGLVGGALMTVLFAPGLLLGSGSLGRTVSRITAVFCVAIGLAATVEMALTPLPKTLAKFPDKTVRVGDVELRVPTHWKIDDQQVVDPFLDLAVSVSDGKVSSPQLNDPRFHDHLQRILDSAKVVRENSRDGR